MECVLEQWKRLLRVRATDNVEVKTAKERIIALETNLATSIAPDPSDEAKFKAWAKEMSNCEGELAGLQRKIADSENLVAWFDALPHLTPKDVIEALPTDVAVVQFFRYSSIEQDDPGIGSERYGALIFSKKKGLIGRRLSDPLVLDSSIDHFRRSIQNRSEDLALKFANLLNKAFWRPIIEDLDKDVHGVIICPTHRLSFLPFSMLADESGEFPIQHYDVGYCGSIRCLMRAEQPSPCVGTGYSGVFVSDYDQVKARNPVNTQLLFENEANVTPFIDIRDIGAATFPDLRGVETEASSVRNLMKELGIPELAWHAGHVDKNLLSSLFDAHSRVIFFSGHSFVMPRLGIAKRTLLEDSEVIEMRRQLPFAQECLVLSKGPSTLQAIASGTSLSAENNGLVSAMEIANTDLSAVSLAIINSCHSLASADEHGLSSLASANLSNFRTAIEIAGVQNTLMTVLPIVDSNLETEPGKMACDMVRRILSKEAQQAPWRLTSKVQREYAAHLIQSEGYLEAMQTVAPYVCYGSDRSMLCAMSAGNH